jgi:hypothetical protein
MTAKATQLKVKSEGWAVAAPGEGSILETWMDVGFRETD